MKNICWILFHVVGITSIVSLTAYLSIDEKERKKVNQKIKDLKDGKINLMDICKKESEN